MARKTQAQAEARQRKQKIIVAVGGVLLVALLAIQVPKLMKQSSPPAETSAASTKSESSTGTSSSEAATPSSGATAETPAPVQPVKAPKSQTAQLAGVVIVPEQPVAAGEGQLDSFSRFTVKDPFVQQVQKDELPSPAEVAASGQQPEQEQPAPKPTATKPPATGGETTESPGTGIVTVGTGTAPEQPAATMAMLRVNGKLHVVELEKKFPASDKAFVLRSLKPGSATIGVAGGSFAGGSEALTLRLGRAVTLVNTATGVRYVVRLVYVGADAAQITGFSSKKK